MTPVSINSLVAVSGDSIYYNPSFRRVLQSNYHYIKSSLGANTIPIPANIAYQNEFNFYGVLDAMSIPKCYQWIVMMLNDMSSPNQFNRNVTSFYMPSTNILQIIKNTYNSTKN